MPSHGSCSVKATIYAVLLCSPENGIPDDLEQTTLAKARLVAGSTLRAIVVASIIVMDDEAEIVR